ncbi:MAG TPA: SpoIIE family protein phosphatase [Tepidisphaeraceae bacterium]|nr:SpoIIE family protein phosphatase [Tepidisphaeraceae bacterium]
MSDPPTPRRGLDLTFRAKLVLAMCGMVLLAGGVVIAVADRGNRSSTRTLADSLFREVSGHAVTQTRDFVLRAAPLAQSLEQLANQGLAIDDLDKLGPQLLAFLKGNAGMTWVLYGDESGDYTGATRLSDGRLHVERTHIVDGKTHLTEYEVQSDGEWKIFRKDDDSGYDPRTRPFYRLAKEKGRLAWTPPYMFFTQNLPGISCVVPLNRPGGGLRGVFSVEFDLNALSEFVTQLSLSPNSSVFLFTPDQTLLAHPSQRNRAGRDIRRSGAMLTLADTGDPLVEAFRQHLKPEFLQGAATDQFHFFQFDHGEVGYLASTTVFPIGDGQSWVVGAIAPQSDFLSAVWRARWMSLGAAAIALLAAGLLAAAMARRISRPVHALIGFLQRVGGGDLEARADFHGGREFRQLSLALNQMISDLRERLHLSNSLAVAMEVQKSLLPAGDPVSPLLDIAGRSHYCDQTGGDYFDFIDVSPLSDSSMLVAVGDVMGHGIAAALLMAAARASLRTNILDRPTLGQLLTRINRVLAADNRHSRFMTLALLQIDAQTGTMTWASAGHDPAIIYDSISDEFRELQYGDMPLGLDEGVEYPEYRDGDCLRDGCVAVIATDGVWETFNETDEQYGKERLRGLIRVSHALSASDIAAAIEADLARFRGKRRHHDDVTFVIVKPAPKAGCSSNKQTVTQEKVP